jgi:dolichyl-phosphate beta-glucosyltransferase
MAISVVIPAYNEVDTLPPHLARLVPLLERVAPQSWEVIVADDGSTDRTPEVVESLGLGQVRVLRGGANAGKGAAVRRGVAASVGDMVLTCDADMATPPETLVPFVEALRAGADIVIGNRRAAQARIERPQPWVRRVLGAGFLALCRRLTGVRLQDYNCGFKLFRGEVAREIMSQVQTDGWAIDMESLAIAVRRGARVVEVPVVWRSGDRSAVRVVRDVFATLREMVRIWWRLRAS